IGRTKGKARQPPGWGGGRRLEGWGRWGRGGGGGRHRVVREDSYLDRDGGGVARSRRGGRADAGRRDRDRNIPGRRRRGAKREQGGNRCADPPPPHRPGGGPPG